jgi:hypothetical protein
MHTQLKSVNSSCGIVKKITGKVMVSVLAMHLLPRRYSARGPTQADEDNAFEARVKKEGMSRETTCGGRWLYST